MVTMIKTAAFAGLAADVPGAAVDGMVTRLGSSRGQHLDVGGSAHLVQFYDGDEFLFDIVSRYVGAGLAGGEGVIVIATADHLRGLRMGLARNAFDVDRACDSGQLTLLDANETLSKFVCDGRVDAQRFSATIAPVVEQCGARHGTVRAYGEMVDVLCARGEHGLALQLEQFWNELIARRPLALLCGYALQNFPDAHHAERFHAVCQAHSHVAPAESFAALVTEDARLREVSALQQRARALEAELQRSKVLQDALRQREAELQGFLDNAVEGIHWVGPEGRIVYANRAELNLLGYAAEEYIGRHIADFHVDAEIIQDILARLKRGEELRGVEARLRAKDGTIRHVLISSNVYRRDGQFMHTRCFTRDITDRKRAENEQILARRKVEMIVQELEVANRMKDDFLATVSHELRTPLNAILGWTRMLRSGKLSDERRERALEIIERNANAQTQLIEDLLDVSRIISGKMRLTIEPVDMVQVVRNALDAVRPAASGKGIAITEDFEAAAMPSLGDSGRLQQVVWNLLSNAVKFTSKGGHVQVLIRKRDAFIEIVIADDGQGIEPEFLPHVFERFRQADSTISRTHMGLGLGLAIVRHLVELHGGHVKVESEGRGQGASFFVSLPISPPRSMSVQQLPAVRQPIDVSAFVCPPELEGAHVLIVEDDQDSRELLVHALEPCRARVSAAANASEALAIVERTRPDVIVSDIGLPGEDGYAFIRKLRALPRHQGGRTPAVALTAYARVEDRTKALVAGFNMHIPKPVEPAELMAVLASLSTLFPRR